MPRLRIHFSKKGYACFISHIDLPMLFGRAARRAGLRSEQTQGFSPHPRLALCPPLPVGVVGLREPADFWFEAWGGESLGRWRAHMPDGIEILSAHAVVDGVSLNKLCRAASYTIEPLNGANVGAMSRVLGEYLGEANVLLDIGASEGRVLVSANDLEKYGPSRMVSKLVESGLIGGWSDVAVARTAVGGWDGERREVIPLTEEF